VQIKQLIKNFGKASVERRHRDGYYFGNFCELDEKVQQAALPPAYKYASEITGLNELLEKYQHVFKASASGRQRIPRQIQNNPKDPLVKQINSV